MAMPMILPAAHDGVGEHGGTCDPALDRKLDRGRAQRLRRRAALSVLTNVLVIVELDDHGRRRPVLEDIASFEADVLESFFAFECAAHLICAFEI